MSIEIKYSVYECVDSGDHTKFVEQNYENSPYSSMEDALNDIETFGEQYTEYTIITSVFNGC